MIAVEGLYSQHAYVGLWCNICLCISKPDSFAKKCFSIVFRIILIMLMLASACFTSIQIVNISKDPGL